MDKNESLFLMVFIVLGIISGCQNNISGAPTENISPEGKTKTGVQPDVIVPYGKPITVDGVMEIEEWAKAAVVGFSDSSELLFLADGEFLYLGIREHSGEMIAANVFVNLEKEISVFHSSAALGTAVYQQEKNTWKKTQDFDWCCRQIDKTDQAMKDLEDQFKAEGWVASNSRRGMPNEIEYQIKIPAEDLIIAVNFLRASDPDKKMPWPVGLDDDCTIPTPGGSPQEMGFDINQWGLIHVEYYDK